MGWWLLALVLFISGAAMFFEGRQPEGIGAPTRMTLAGGGTVAVALGLAIWRFWVWFGPILGYRLSH